MAKTPQPASQSAGSGTPRSHSTTAGFRQTRRAHALELAEDYVELVNDLIEHSGEARLVDIAAHMGVSHVTANKTIARLQRDGLVDKLPYRSVFLTPEGKRLAEEVRKRHKTVFDCLLALGVPERQARIDAEGIEHHISPVTLRAMARFANAARGAP